MAYFLGYSAFNTYALFFYSEHLHVPAALIGHAWLLFGVWNTLNDGLCGWLVDRVPVRLGRPTLPVLLLGVPVGAMFLLVFNPPGCVIARGPAGLVWYFLVTVSPYDLLQTIVNISQGAAFPEMAVDDRGRARPAAIR